MLFNPLDMLRLTFLTGEFGEILFCNGIAVIVPHSFLFSTVGFRGYGIGLQVADIVGNLPYSVTEIGVIGVSGIITVNRHLRKPLFRFGSKAGAIGKNKADEMSFWTKDEFTRFVECIADKPMAYTAYNTLFWTGLRIGELMALTRADLDFTAKTLTVNKSYQRLGDRDVITPPKTPKSNRTVSIPDFLCSLLKEYCDSLYDITDSDRIFPFTKHYLHHEMKRGCEKSGVKRIRLHDIRHSHCALLYELGIPPLEIAERLGHERVETTMQVYAHLYPNKQEKLSAKLDNLMKNGGDGNG